MLLERGHLRHPDVLGEVGDHGDVAEGGATGTGAVERGRELAQGPGQVDAVGGRLHGHAAAGSHPRHRAHPAGGDRSVRAIKAVQAPEELGFEPIDGAPEVDQILAQRVRRELIDGLVNQPIDGVIETLARIRDREGFHSRIIPNICSPTPRTMWWSLAGYRHFRQKHAATGRSWSIRV